MPGQKETCSSTPSSSDILSRLQEFAFQKRNDTRQLTYESTLGSVENKSGKYEETGFTQTDTQKNSTEVKVESNKLLNDHKGASLKNYVDSGDERSNHITGKDVGCVSVTPTDSGTELPDNNNDANSEKQGGCLSSDELKSRIRRSYDILSRSKNISHSSPDNTEKCETMENHTCPDLAAQIQRAYSSLSSLGKHKRFVIESSDEDAQGKNNDEESSSLQKCVATFSNDPSISSNENDIEYKEKCLTDLRLAFPSANFMELQDVLVAHNWSVEASVEHLSKLTALRNTSRKRKCVIESDSNDDDSGSYADRFAISRKSSLHNTTKKGIIFLSDDSEDEADINLRRRVKRLKPALNKSRKAKSKKPISSDDDIDDGKSYNHEQDVLYDSDSSDLDDTMTPARQMVLSFYETATMDELLSIPGCSKKKAETIIELRPFSGWIDLVTKFQSCKNLNTDLINGAKEIINSRKIVMQLMRKCEDLAERLEQRVARLLSEDVVISNDEGHLKEQPPMLNPNMKLAPYQLLGLNWLILLHQQNVNGILADEMGLGKTVQAVAFLTYLISEGDKGPHLIVVPSSTLDNWVRELNTWWPTVRLLIYHGSQEERRSIRMKIIMGRENHFNALITTYSMIAGHSDDRVLFRKVKFHYVVFDEAHMLKNMETQRYQSLMKIKAKRRLLLTGTPLQNNLVELMSLLVFVMPNMFDNKVDHLKSMFSSVSKDTSEEGRGVFEKERVDQAKRIMKPFVLRRLKREVLHELPKKTDEIMYCSLSLSQRELYDNLVFKLSQQLRDTKEKAISNTSGIGMMMQLRKLANHPLLMRYYYDDNKLRKMAELMLREPSHSDANEEFVFEDMQVMSDFELHKLCKTYQSLSSYALGPQHIIDSGKFMKLSQILTEMKAKGFRILLFSQFVMVLDIIEEYMNIKEHRYLRLDGSTPVNERQDLIDEFSNDSSIFVFLLSTRAGGLGINLTAANVVILHDIDFNPYNDKQAEDRCHRIGQTRDVEIIRLISKDTIEEGILQAAQRKLKLEKDITSNESQTGNEELNDVASLLKEALGL